MYAKVMSINDDLVITYFTLATDISDEKIRTYEKKLKKENPINVKKELAFEIVKQLHNQKSAEQAQKEFEKTIQDKDINIEVFPTKNFFSTIFDIVSQLAGNDSRSETKRLIQQGGVSVNNKKINLQDANQNIKEGMIIKVGQRKIVRIQIKHRV
jgi:tyrosyl-tRNA synthetase